MEVDPPQSHAHARVGPREAGFTLVEILVVLGIIVLVLAIGVMSLRASRGTGAQLELASVARMYGDAIERYQTDHGRKVPVWNSADWRAANANAGPIRRLAIGGSTTTRPYLTRPVPEQLTRGGATGAVWRTTAPARSQQGGALVYRRLTPHTYRIDAYWQGRLVCRTGDGITGSAEDRC